MIVTYPVAGASPDNYMHWHQIDWQQCHKIVKRLQARIVKATQEGRWNKVKALQHLLTHSFSGKAIAVKRVTENRGKKTPGVDGEVWSTPASKSQALISLKRRGYKPLPLRRIYIPKANGKKQRPLGIPAMKDRAMQALYLLALEPIAETLADKHSYGFRPERSTADAIEQCYACLSRKFDAQWIFEADIEGCFDNLSHEWLLTNIPTDKVILRKWLKAGFLELGNFHPTKAGTPQGGIISPVLANMALDGIGKILSSKFPMKITSRKKTFQVNYVRYCDDFVITGRSKELLENEAKPLVEKFLQERGLRLSPTKTKITNIKQGFDFLGQNVRKYGNKLLIKPSETSVKNFLSKIRKITNEKKTIPQDQLIKLLNPQIRGWTNYHCHVVSKEIFSKVRHEIWVALWRWAKRRHPRKGSKWVKEKYFKTRNLDNWSFGCRNAYSKEDTLWLENPGRVPIRRHIKVKSTLNPFDPQWREYLENRKKLKTYHSLKRQKQLLSIWQKENGQCPLCKEYFSTETEWDIHHITPKANGGSDETSNLIMMHPNCHRKLHSQNPIVKPALENKELKEA